MSPPRLAGAKVLGLQHRTTESVPSVLAGTAMAVGVPTASIMAWLLAATAGVIMYVLIWSVVLPPE